EEIPSAIEFLKQDLALELIPDFAFKLTFLPSPGWKLFEEAEIDDDTLMQEDEPIQPTINTQGLESEKESTNESLSTIVAPNTKSHYANTVTNIKELKMTIWTSRNWEKNVQQSERIKFYTNRRYDDFRDNTSRMLDSILKRNNDRISFEKIVLPDNVITNQKEIKEAIRNHCSKWSKENPPNPDYQEKWTTSLTQL
ncbi:2867_t:CDS:2, partial [Gigaspora rosea]